MVSKATSDAHLAFWQPPRGPLAVRIEAPDMWTAMWLQFAIAIIEEKEYRRCKLCKKPFELGHKRKDRQSRADKEFCNVTCRVKFHQQRQVKARKMRAKGAKLQAIVKAVGADLQTVKRWVAE